MKRFKNFILDVDGVFTDGKFHYTADGKIAKTFGDADSDALTLLKPFLNIEMISGDKRGFAISEKRINEDMGYPLALVSTFERLDWINAKFDLEETIYMGDGIFDILVFDKIGYSIAPDNAFFNTKQSANYVTKARGGEGAVAEACVHILGNIFSVDINSLLRSEIKSSGIWVKGAHN